MMGQRVCDIDERIFQIMKRGRKFDKELPPKEQHAQAVGMMGNYSCFC
jgi:hypothetical protein